MYELVYYEFDIVQLKASIQKKSKCWHFVSITLPTLALGGVHADDVFSSVVRIKKKDESTISQIGRRWMFDLWEINNSHYHLRN